jgi:glyoxylase-like metal-dependent hydrolase (beta-lactamase superfamily II)
MICTTSTNNSVALDAGLRQHIVSGTSGSGSSSRVSRTPVRTVINTHHHGDHTYGNYLFPGDTIISHELCREQSWTTNSTPRNGSPASSGATCSHGLPS